MQIFKILKKLPNPSKNMSHVGIGIIFLIVLIAVVILFGNRNSIYSIKGETQTLTIFTSSNPINEWEFSQGQLFYLGLDLQEETFELGHDIRLSEDDRLTVEPGTHIKVTSVHRQNQTNVVFVMKNDGKVVATLIKDGQQTSLSDYIELTVEITQPLALPFEGTAYIGEDIGTDVDSLLMSGEVSILEQRFLSSGRYQGEVYNLNTGDRAFVTQHGNTTISKGFIRVTDNESFYFSAISEGNEARVIRYGSQDLVLAPSIWSRVTKDPNVAAITSLIALMFLLLECYLIIRETVLVKSDNE